MSSTPATPHPATPDPATPDTHESGASALPHPPTGHRRGWRRPIAFLGVYAFVTLLLPQVIGLFVADDATRVWNAVNVATYLVLGAAVVALLRPEIREIGAEFRRRPVRVLATALGAFVVIFVVSALLLLVRGDSPITQNQAAVNQFIASSLFATVIVVLIGPLVEELVFREIVIGWPEGRVPTWLLAVASVVGFSLIHVKSFTVAGFAEAGQYVVIGAVTVALYLISGRRLAYPFAAHLLNNLVATGLFIASQAVR